MAAESKRKNTGNAIILFGSVFLMIFISKLNFDKITVNHIMIIVCNLVFIGCGIYANWRSRKAITK
ncbi:hypothetical protein HYN48_07795 [Flavobacterium magnum]|uniref:Uncharacterized protein n=1 Tax=Flavobacterium magnum TaxID=2162713 RepID=A0A2S0RED7_9FLAO|nr:hypothetical protein [Flavobacterium magnum]AWA29985.1 hypothetical protein HYN48_07795 [Flavobacterium magnum]